MKALHDYVGSSLPNQPVAQLYGHEGPIQCVIFTGMCLFVYIDGYLMNEITTLFGSPKMKHDLALGLKRQRKSLSWTTIRNIISFTLT